MLELTLPFQLAKRPTSTQPQFIIPPPPPPPPLNFSLQAPASGETSFADVRAALRHTATPNEKPINPAYDAASKRKGQPTIVGADMMASFLTEMKTHRLRKVGSASDGSFGSSSQPAIRAREVGGEIGNRTEVMIRPREVQDVGNRSEFVPRSNAFAIPAPRAAKSAVNGTRQESTASESDSQPQRKRKLVEESDTSAFGKQIYPSKEFMNLTWIYSTKVSRGCLAREHLKHTQRVGRHSWACVCKEG